jgi:Resolvase, N terminal domain
LGRTQPTIIIIWPLPFETSPCPKLALFDFSAVAFDVYGSLIDWEPSKVTGARPDRRELNRILGKLARGGVVMVTPIDCLGRPTFDLFGIVERIVDAKAQFRSLAEPWADTGTGIVPPSPT